MFRSVCCSAGRCGRSGLGLILWAGTAFCAQQWKPLEAVFGTLKRGHHALPPTRPGLLEKEAGFVFSAGYEISRGDKQGIQTEFWPFPRR